MLSVAAGHCPCSAVTESGKAFSWGFDVFGQCGHGISTQKHLLPRRVDALTGVRARSASTGNLHSLVVTEEGALYSVGSGSQEILGHINEDAEPSPKLVDALRHVRIAAAADGACHSLASPRM